MPRFMWSMCPWQTAKLAVLGASGLVFLVAVWLMRSQTRCRG